MALETFLRWLVEEQLAARHDARRVADDLGTVARRIAERAGDLAGARVIDVGSGAGAVAFGAADRGARVTGVDLDSRVLATGARLATRVEAAVRFVRADARSLPFRDASFDASLHRSVLIYMPNRDRAIEEEHRILIPGGRVSCSESLGEAVDLQADDPAILRVWTGLRDILDEASALSYSFSQKELVALYEGAGFSDVVVEPVPYEVVLGASEDVARAFQARPGAGLSAREYWERAGVPPEFLDEFATRLSREAERGRPARLLAPQGFLTAIRPPK